MQGLFASHHTRFMVHTDDATSVKTMKMQLLLKITNNDNHQAILREFIVSLLFVRFPKHTTTDFI
jgi:hypothetical protein